MSRKSRFISSLLTGLAVAFYIALVLPVQSYLANADAFNYALGALLGSLCLPLVLTFAVVSLALFFLSRWVGQSLHILLLALVVAAFAESGPLSIGLPELNGDFSGYKSLPRAVWDWSILVAIALIPLCCYRWLRGSMTWIALALTVYLGATLFDVKVKSHRPEGMEDFIVPRLVPRTDVVRSAEFSPKRNVIMLILDSISVDACVDAFAADPDLASHFTGFVNYTNNVGMMWTTNRAIPALFEGKCCESVSDLPRFGTAPFRQDSFIKPYLENNCPIYLNLGLYKDGYTNRIKRDDSGMSDPRPSPSSDRMHGMYPMTLPELALFRILPYFAKESFVMGLDVGTNSVQTSSKRIDVNRLWEDGYLWQELASKPVNPQVDLTLHVHHTRGGHPPTKFDRNGTAVKECGAVYANHVEQCIYVYRQVAKLFDVWKTNGVYDSSLIFVVADHSHIFKKPGANYRDMNICAFPSLMVKPQEHSGPLKYDGRPTSHAGIAKLVRMASLKRVMLQDIEVALSSAERRCVELGNGKKVTWSVDANGVVQKSSSVDMVVRDAHSLKPLAVGKRYSFKIEDNSYPDFCVRGGRQGDWAGMEGSAMEFDFRVAEPHRAYDFEFTFNPGRLGDQSIRVESGNLRLYERDQALLLGVRSDEGGIVNVRFGNDEGRKFALRGMIVREHNEHTQEKEGTVWANDVEIAASKSKWNFKKIPFALSEGGTYRFTADRLDVTSGTGKVISVVLYNFKTDRREAQKTFRIDLSNSYGIWDWKFQVPTASGDYRCLIYAGAAGETAGIGIHAKNVKIMELCSK